MWVMRQYLLFLLYKVGNIRGPTTINQSGAVFLPVQHRMIQIATKYKSSSVWTNCILPGQCYLFSSGVILSGPGLCKCYLHSDHVSWMDFPWYQAGGVKEGAIWASGWEVRYIKCRSAVVCYISEINARWCVIFFFFFGQRQRGKTRSESEIYRLICLWLLYSHERQHCVGGFIVDEGYDCADATWAVIAAGINTAGWWCCNHRLIL